MLIPQIIDESEVLVRFVFLDNFKKKNISTEKIIDQDIFLDTRLVGISLQRSFYSSLEFCKAQAKSISNKIYVGFVLFRKSDYLDACNEFKIIRENFESLIEFTPLDSDNQYLLDRNIIHTDDIGNPSHSDILYLNPALLPDEVKPNIPLRIFSKILFKKSKVLIDDAFDLEEINFQPFESYF